MQNYLKKLAQNIKKNRQASNDKALELFKLLPNGVTLLDIGAAGGIQPRWGKVCEYLNFIGVEPDDRSNKGLKNNNKFRNIKILNTLLGVRKQKLNLIFVKSHWFHLHINLIENF